MRLFVRGAGITVLLVLQQVLLPSSASTQVDPCHPVPIPGLCEDPGPSPSPSPSPILPDPEDLTGGGGPGTQGGPDGIGGAGGSPTGGKSSGEARGGGQGRKVEEGARPAVSEPPAPPAGPFVVSSPNNSARVIEILEPLTRYGFTLQELVLRTVGPFPVAGLAYWTDDWHACRDGCSRFHEGLDIFAEHGTPLVAIADGYVSQKLMGELSGTSIEITDANGVQYFYAHLSGWAEPISVGDRVEVGQVIGYVGNTGNAISTPPHVHLEVQPGGIPVPPKPFVDRWLNIAELEAQQLALRYTGEPLPAASSFRLTRTFDLAGGGTVLEGDAQRLLALAGFQPSVSSLELARSLLGEMAWEIDWAGQADAQLAQLAQRFSTQSIAHDLSGASPWAPLGVSSQPVEGLPTEAEVGD